jgi:hypothetical protein
MLIPSYLQYAAKKNLKPFLFSLIFQEILLTNNQLRISKFNFSIASALEQVSFYYFLTNFTKFR